MYMNKKMEKVERVNKDIFFENDKAGPSKITYGFNINKALDKMDLLNPFENDLNNLVSNI